jgi:hypothetical protein
MKFLVTFLATGVVLFHPPNAHRTRPYWIGDFETGNLSQWKFVDDGGGHGRVAVVRAPIRQGRYAVALTATSAAHAVGTPNGNSVFLYNDFSHKRGVSGTSAWYSWFVYFPAGVRYPPGLFTEWHNDTAPLAAWPDCNGGSHGEYANLAFNIRYRGEDPPHIRLRVMGGRSCSPDQLWILGPVLRTNHWYRFLVHIVWSPSPASGRVGWWVDGRKIFNRKLSTLYTRPDGTISRTKFMLGNYRVATPYPTTYYFDDVVMGPTKTSVLSH